MDTVKLASVIAFVIGIGLIGAIAFVLLTPQTPSTAAAETEKPTVEITIIATEEGGRFLFTRPGQEQKVPGPEIKVKVGDIVKIILNNLGKIPHSLAVVNEKRYDATPLFNAAIGSTSRPIPAGQQSSIVFKPNRPGEYYYVCQVPGHIELGMWGQFIVEE